MSGYKSYEHTKLRAAFGLVDDFASLHSQNSDEARFQLLECASSVIGGFDYRRFNKSFSIPSAVSSRHLSTYSGALADSIRESGIASQVALTILAREMLDDSIKKANGVFHTDYRLAEFLAESISNRVEGLPSVIDPASGTGMLLASTACLAAKKNPDGLGRWLADRVYAADLSAASLRGARLSLACFTRDVGEIKAMFEKWHVQDSLLAPSSVWHDMGAPFDLVLANPPWERVKLTKHEFLKSRGSDRHYGASVDQRQLQDFDEEKSRVASHAAKLVDRYPLLSNGEPDLYVAFSALAMELTADGGMGAVFVPAGLIRSQSTEVLRRHIMAKAKDLRITVLDNRARHFEIDSRFKFLLLNYSRKIGSGRSLKLCFGRCDNELVESSKPVSIALKKLEQIRKDLTVPEVRTAAEWNLYCRLQSSGVINPDNASKWSMEFCREVDMTHGRKHFQRQRKRGSLPVVEGRMIQPYRFGAKGYVRGEGRKAIWNNNNPGVSRVTPQFWLPHSALGSKAMERVDKPRVGFCDITGQTNERSMMGALIPPGVVCGNKVPTILFPNDPSEDRLYVWLAIVNSFVFDWLMRRVVTTSVNYFLLKSVALPELDLGAKRSKDLIRLSREIYEMDRRAWLDFEGLWRLAGLRAEVDALVSGLYGCREADIKLIFRDFPLLDRGQPAIFNESHSTVTRDIVCSRLFDNESSGDSLFHRRLKRAKERGAIPYISSEFSEGVREALKLGRLNERQSNRQNTAA